MEHFDGRRFFAPGVQLKTLRELLRWQLSGERRRWPAHRDIPPAPKPATRVTGSQLAVTLVNHATVLLQVCGLNILTDPVWAERASPFRFIGPRRVHAPGIALEDLPPIDLVLISHNHYDHLDTVTLRRLVRRQRPLFITPLGNAEIIADAIRGASDAPIAELDWEQSREVSRDVRVHCEPALHWSSRSIGDRNKALWSAFSITTPDGHIYFAGDTGFGDGSHFRDVARRHGPVRLALLPIGAYEPRWFMAPFHMNPDEAVKAFRLLEARYALAIHHGCFPLADEGIDEPVEALRDALIRYGVTSDRFVAAAPGAPWAPPAFEKEEREEGGGGLVSSSALVRHSC